MQQAISRGHDVVAVVRDASKVSQDVAVRTLDLTSITSDAIASIFVDVDVVIASIGGRAAQNHQVVHKPQNNYYSTYLKRAHHVCYGLAVPVA
jgi:putative NADH-flavin reductase